MRGRQPEDQRFVGLWFRHAQASLPSGSLLRSWLVIHIDQWNRPFAAYLHSPLSKKEHASGQ